MATFFRDLVKMEGLPKQSIPAEYKGVLIIVNATATMCKSYDAATGRIFGPFVNYDYSAELAAYVNPKDDAIDFLDPADYIKPQAKLFWACPKLLQCFIETKYVWNSVPRLKVMFHELINGEVYAETYFMQDIQQNKWKEIDRTMRENEDVDDFWMILQQLFLFYYFLKSITRKQYQYAFGIQQVNWMVNKNNPEGELCTGGIEMHYWEDIPEKEREVIETALKGRYESRKTTTSPILLDRTVWYEFYCGGVWSGFGTERHFYPVPESFNFSAFACTHVAHLVFGILNSDSLFKFIYQNNRRPLAAHLPDAPSKNLTVFHGHRLPILSNWIHDLNHTFPPKNMDSKSHNMCNFTGFDYVKEKCGLDQDPAQFIEDFEKEGSPLNLCLNAETPLRQVFKDKTTKNFTRFEVLNEFGSVYFKPQPIVLGGKRSRRRTRRRKK